MVSKQNASNYEINYEEQPINTEHSNESIESLVFNQIVEIVPTDFCNQPYQCHDYYLLRLEQPILLQNQWY